MCIRDRGGELCIDGWLEGDIVLDGGTLQVDDDTSISSASAISIASASELKLADGVSLTYEGDAISLNANKLSVSGGGSLVLKTDGTNPLTLNDKDSELEFSGNSATATTTVSHVKINAGDTANMPVLRMTESGVIKNLTQQEFAEVNFASGKTLTLEQDFAVPGSKQMTVSGAAGILKTASSISLAGTLAVSAANPSLEGGTVALSGGTLQADNDMTVKSALASQADSSISVAAGKKITYTGSTFNIGAHSLTLSGSGSFENTGTLALDNSSSTLSLNGISRVKNISVTGDLTSGKLEAAQNSQIDKLSLSGSSRIDIAGQKTLTLASAVEIPVNKSMELIGSGGGTISLGDNMTLTGDMKISAADTIQGSTLALNGGSLQVGQDTSIASDLLHQSSSEIEVSAGKTLTYTGSAVNIEDSTLTISGGGKFTNSQDLIFNDAASVLNLNGIAEISKVKFPGSLTTGKLIAAEDVSIQSLTHTGESIIDISSGKTLTVKGDFGVDDNLSLIHI